MPWARLKPLNPERGIVKERYGLAGKTFQGGDGSPGKIPVWYRVSRRQAAYMATKKQKNGDPFSPDAFDIVQTAEEKDEINSRENYLRMTRAGLAAPPPPSVAQPREENLTREGKRGRVTMAELADDDDDVPSMDGREAALAGLDEPADIIDDEVDGMVDAARGTHEEMNESSRGLMTSASEQAEMNEEARDAVPSFNNLETDGDERPPRRQRPAAIAAQKAEDAALAQAAKDRDEKAAKAKAKRAKTKTTRRGLPPSGGRGKK
jgi:hypothetical protein